MATMNRKRQDRIRKLARRRKIRAKDRVKNRKIDQRKYYGLGTEIDQYKEAMVEAVDREQIEEVVEFAIQENVSKESFQSKENFDDLLERINNLDNIFGAGLINQLAGVLERSFDKGTRRALTIDGEDIKEVSELEDAEINQAQLDELMRDQEQYFKNISSDAKDRLRGELQQSIEEGESIPEAKDRIMDEMDTFTEHRAETTARTETIKASARGTEHSFEQAGVERVIWLATLDERTCEVCQDLNESIWDLDDNERPTPAKDTHPNCRCTYVADI